MFRRALSACLLALAVSACSSEDPSPGDHLGGAASAGAAGTSTSGTSGTAGAAGAPAGGGGAGGSVGGAGGALAGTGGVAGSAAGAGAGGVAGAPLGGTGGVAGDAAGGAAGSDAGGAGMGGVAGSTAGAGTGGACAGPGCGPVSVIDYPTPPGAVESPLYTVTVDGKPLFVEKMTKFAPEMQVHYAHCSLAGEGAATVAVTVSESFNSYTVSPKSRNLAVSKSGNTINFDTGPNYLIVQFDQKELLFILIDSVEESPPELGDADVKNIADYGVDATGATLETQKIQMAIDAASGAAQNILYFPPGKYKVGELWLKSNMTLYLAGGALLYGSGNTGDFNTGSGGINIEGCSHGMIRMYKIKNTKILGRGVIDANGKAIRGQNDTKVNLLKIEDSSDILVDGVLVRDPSFWDTLIYRSDQVTIQNYKMINCRPTTTVYNNTDGVNFDESTNGKLYNAFLYTGDDSMATKNEEPSGTVNTKNILHEKVVAYSNSVGCKIGTKTMGQSMDGVTFRDIDVVKAGRALNIDAYDTAVVQNTHFENIRVEAADSVFIELAEDMPPDWRDAANQSIIKDTYFTDIVSYGPKNINLHGGSAMYNITGVHFENLTIRDQPVTSQTDPDATWSINSYVSNITFTNP